MKIITIFVLLFFVIIKLCAQDYLISFKGIGEGTEINLVKVENLNQGTSLTLQGNQVLHLKNNITGMHLVKYNLDNEIKIYPNPMFEYTSVEFDVPNEGTAIIELFDFSGRKILHSNNHFALGRQTYRITGLQSGIYVVRVCTGNYLLSGKLLCKNDIDGIPELVCQESNSLQRSTNILKSLDARTEMQYNEGDRLKFTATYDKFSSVLVDVPNQSKEIVFNLVECTDAGGKNYPVVQIGNQIWMAENLAYLPAVYPSAIGSQSESCYYVLNYQGSDTMVAKSENNYRSHGVLYNWQAAKTSCPEGWHLPTDAEWQQLEMHFGMTQIQVDSTGWRGTDQGSQMKEASGWNNDGHGSNSIGFSALPGGCRSLNNYFHYIGDRGHWWSSTEILDAFASYRALDFEYNNVFRSNTSKELGYSVRCVRH